MEGILALSIPIVAIVCWSPIGRAIAEKLKDNTGASPGLVREIAILKNHVLGLEAKVEQQQAQLLELQESVTFFEQLEKGKETEKKQIQ